MSPTAKTTLMGLATAMLASGCISPPHLTYDHGRAYTEAFVAQADLTRPSAAGSQYQLYGVEAAQIRIRVQEESTDEETGESKTDSK